MMDMFRSVSLTAQTECRVGSVGGRWGRAVGGAAVFQCLSGLYLGQQQSRSGHGEGRELACDKRRLLCLFGE